MHNLGGQFETFLVEEYVHEITKLSRHLRQVSDFYKTESLVQADGTSVCFADSRYE